MTPVTIAAKFGESPLTVGNSGSADVSGVYVKTGGYVSWGEPIGALGCTGRATGTHLHFELWINGGPVDPLDYLP